MHKEPKPIQDMPVLLNSKKANYVAFILVVITVFIIGAYLFWISRDSWQPQETGAFPTSIDELEKIVEGARSEYHAVKEKYDVVKSELDTKEEALIEAKGRLRDRVEGVLGES